MTLLGTGGAYLALTAGYEMTSGACAAFSPTCRKARAVNGNRKLISCRQGAF
jgi:hypothetical protein